MARKPGRDENEDPGAFIGRLPEREAETIPGGIGRKDERVSAVGTQRGTVRGPEPTEADETTPPGAWRAHDRP